MFKIAKHLISLLGRGGQSALRFARLRMEKRHNYVRKVAETSVQMFISNDKVCFEYKYSYETLDLTILNWAGLVFFTAFAIASVLHCAGPVIIT